nr:TetR family transcriptional regulator [Nocardiopsis algeriensis]
MRERKKEQTRRAVHEAALRLAVERGFDNVTVDAIAEAADISRRTFSNYFAGKEDAVLYAGEQRIADLVGALHDRPADEPAWTALRAAARALYGAESPSSDREWAQRTRMVHQHPSLLARQLANQHTLSRDLEAAVKGRALPAGTSRPALLVAAFLSGLRIALSEWTEAQDDRLLIDVVEEALDEVEKPFGT